MSKDQTYWMNRMKDLEASRHREAEQVVQDLESIYRNAERQIEADISRWYGRFANNNGVVSMADARKLLTSGELKEFKWTLKEYREHAKDNLDGKWNRELENASARWHISRLEALKYQLQNSVEVLAGGQLDALDALLKSTYSEGYGQTAFMIQSGIGIGWDIAGLSEKAIQTVLQKPWALDGRNFSSRIWENKQALVGELQKQLTQNMMTGGDINKIIDSIEKKFGVARSNAARLVYTENAYALSVALGDSYRETGVERVYFIAVLDERTSDICQSMDGTVIEMKDYQPGITVPPLHPWCRSTTAPYYADMKGLGERAASDPDTGKTYYVPRDMTYPEWKETFVTDPVTGEAGSKSKLEEAIDKAVSGGVVSAVRKKLQKTNIAYKAVEPLSKELTDEEIIEKLAGGDMTKGSCSSVAFAYAGNKGGMDVRDFRGGESQSFFSRTGHIEEIASLPNVDSVIVNAYNDFKGVHELYQSMEPGKLYYLATGRHAAIIKKTDEGYKYLEMQSGYQNGWFTLNDERLKRRFCCKKSHSVAGYKYEDTNILIEVESLGKNEEFHKILGYLNTKESEQKKGAAGSVK